MGDTTKVQEYTVASGILIENRRLLLVQNRRRNGSLDWSTPGGVVDPGESVLEALTREVNEETALAVTSWSTLLYAVEAEFAARQITLRAEIYRAELFSGNVAIDDPDEIVVDGGWVERERASELLVASPRWVAEPLHHALDELFADDDPSTRTAPAEPATWRYRIEEAPISDAERTEASGDATKLRRRRRDVNVVLLDGPSP